MSTPIARRRFQREGRVRLGTLVTGVALPPLEERFERLEKTLRIRRQVGGDHDGTLEGVHPRLAQTVGGPEPLSCNISRKCCVGSSR